MKRLGFTLIELMVTIAIMGIVVSSIFGLMTYVNSSLTRTVNQSDIQTDVQFALNQIQSQVSFASKVTLHKDVPTTFDPKLNYIFIKNGIIYQKLANQPESVLLSNQLNIAHAATLGFSKVGTQQIGKQEITINIGRSVSSQEFDSSAIKGLLNLSGEIVLDGLALGETAQALSFSYSSNAKQLLSVSLEDSINTFLSGDIQGFISGNEAVIYVPYGTDRATLKPSFTIAGTKLEVAGVARISGTFTLDMNTAKDFYVFAEDGSSKKYEVRVLHLSQTPPSATGVRINVFDKDEVTPIPLAWDTSVLEGDYLFVSNDNGSEDGSAYRWSMSATQNGTYTPITNASSRRLKISDFSSVNFVNKWVRFEVKTRANNTVEDPNWQVSEPQEVKKDPNNPIWKRIVEDLHYKYQTPEWRQEYDDKLVKGGFPPYEVIVKVRKEIEQGGTKDTTFKIEANVDASTIKMSGKTQYLGSYFAVDMEDFAPGGNTDSYKLTFKTNLKSGTNGYGVALSNSLDVDNKDYGYMLQFDPGASGFILRRHAGTQYGPEALGVQRHTYSGGTWTPVATEPKYDGTWSFASYRPTNTRIHDWTGLDTKVNTLWFTKNYVTEMTIQRQLDKSIILKVVSWPEGFENNRSKEMWFGDFGEYSYTATEKFVGRTPASSLVIPTNQRGSETSLRPVSSILDNYIGFRSWGSGSYEANFIDLKLDKGFEMSIKKADFLVETKLDQTKVSNKLLIEMSEPIRVNSFDLNKIKLNPALGTVMAYTRHPSNPNAAVLTFSNALNQSQFVNALENASITLERGGIRHVNAGDVVITNGTNFKVTGIKEEIVKINLASYDQRNNTNKSLAKNALDTSVRLSNVAENFILIPTTTPNQYFVKHELTDRYLNYKGFSANVNLDTIGNNISFVWQISQLSNGDYEIKSASSTTQLLAVPITLGNPIITSNAASSDKRRWIITVVN